MTVPKERCQDLIGKKVRLLRRIESRGGTVFKVNEVGKISTTWRGRYGIDFTNPSRYVRGVLRCEFRVLP